MQQLCRTIDPDDHGFALEGHEHEGDAVQRLQMCRRFVATAGQIEPDNTLWRENAQAVEPLWRGVYAPIGCSRGNKEHLLFLNKVGEALIECGEWVWHGFLVVFETDCPNPTDSMLSVAAEHSFAHGDLLPCAAPTDCSN